MIKISNLRKENYGEWTRLVVDVDWGIEKLNKISTNLWFSVKKENEEMLTTDVYDAFLLVPLYIGMYYKQDLVINGPVSKNLYKNIMWYVQRIFCDFSKSLSKIDVKVEGFRVVEKKNNLIGTGISCGIDSFTTIYDRYINEEDQDYKINSLFLFNCGTHGDFDNPISKNLYNERFKRNSNAAKELGLPIYQVESNLHQFTHTIGEEQLGFLAIYSCIYSLQKYISRYYTSSAIEYEELKQFYGSFDDLDMAGFCETYLVPLLSTEGVILVNDGSQYTRVEKTNRIVDWNVAQEYLNVCIANTSDAHNCSKCFKCMRTLLVLDAFNKINNYKNIFDLDIYKKYRFYNLCLFVLKKNKDVFAYEIISLYKEKKLFVPPYFVALINVFIHKAIRKLKKVFGKKE